MIYRFFYIKPLGSNFVTRTALNGYLQFGWLFRVTHRINFVTFTTSLKQILK